MLNRCRCSFLLLIAASLSLAACTPQIVTVAVTMPPETFVITATPTVTPPPATPGPKALTVCLVGEPDTLYLYGGSQVQAARHVMEALYDGPIDYRDYDHHPVILQRLPSLTDGDAITRTMRVREGSRVVDAAGEVVALTEGMLVRPAGCRTDDCAVEFDGEPLQMERLEATFFMREDVAWSDGEPLTARDSVFGYQVASDPATPGYRYLAERTRSYSMLDDWRTKWVGLPGFLPGDYYLNFFPPLPHHQLEERSPASLVYAKDTRRYPLGWGPFVIDEWVAGDRITFVPNEHYFRAGDGLPLLDQVVFRFKDDASEVVADLISGECDIGTHDAGFDSLASMLIEAQQKGLLGIVMAPGDSWEQIDFGIQPVAGYRRPDFFGEVRVRRAFAQCIDRWAIVDEVAYGRSIILDAYLPPMHPLYAVDEIAYWDYDPAAGQALLEQVGWLDEDGDGVRESRGVDGVRDNTPFEIALLVPLKEDDPIPQQVAPIIKTNLADCGIRVNVEPLPGWRLEADGPEGPFFGRQFDLAQTTRYFHGTPACEHYVSSEIPERGRWYGSNASGYANPEYDDACQAAQQSLPRTATYEEAHERVQAIFSQDLPAVPLFMRLRIAVTRPDVVNFALDATAPSELWNIEVLDIESPE